MGADAKTLGITMLPDPSQLLYAEVRAVETGIEDTYNIEIKSGLSAGESVIKQSSGSSSMSNEAFFIGGMGVAGEAVKLPAGGNFTGGGPRQFGNGSNRG
jgi:hypothetical protein